MYDSKGHLKQVYRCKDSSEKSRLRITSLFVDFNKDVSINNSFGELKSLEIDTVIVVFTGFDGYEIDTLVKNLSKQLLRG